MKHVDEMRIRTRAKGQGYVRQLVSSHNVNRDVKLRFSVLLRSKQTCLRGRPATLSRSDMDFSRTKYKT